MSKSRRNLLKQHHSSALWSYGSSKALNEVISERSKEKLSWCCLHELIPFVLCLLSDRSNAFADCRHIPALLQLLNHCLLQNNHRAVQGATSDCFSQSLWKAASWQNREETRTLVGKRTGTCKRVSQQASRIPSYLHSQAYSPHVHWIQHSCSHPESWLCNNIRKSS